MNRYAHKIKALFFWSLAVAIVAAPVLQAHMNVFASPDQHQCCCCCDCPAPKCEPSRPIQPEKGTCGCSVAEPDPIPDAPLVAERPAASSSDFVADLTPEVVSLRLSTDQPEQTELSLSPIGQGPPLYVLNSAFLI